MPGNESARQVVLRGLYGCMGQMPNSLEGATACLGDMGGPGFDFSLSPERIPEVDLPPANPAAEAARTIRLTDRLFTKVLQAAAGTPAEARYRTEVETFLRWFGDKQTTITVSPNFTRRVTTKWEPRGADIKDLGTKLALDRYELLMSLLYVGCVVKKQADPTTTNPYMNRVGWWLGVGGGGGEFRNLLDPTPGRRNEVLELLVMETPNGAAGGYTPDFGLGRTENIWTNRVPPEITQRLSIPGRPLQGVFLDGIIEQYTNRYQGPGVIDHTGCGGLHPFRGAALGGNLDQTLETDFMHIGWTYARYIATGQITNAFEKAVHMISGLNADDEVKQRAYELVYLKAGTEDLAGLYATNLRRMDEFVGQTFKHLVQTSGRKGGTLGTAARERMGKDSAS